MYQANTRLSRRTFLTIAAAATLPRARAAAKYRRYNVTSDGGKRALASYAKGVEAMLKLPAEHPQNWFHNAFVHLMDCPHGNWWFYVWHRGFIGYFEQTIRNLSGDPAFALPYWDWTTQPEIPAAMFDGVLTPSHPLFAKNTANLGVFTSSLKPALTSYFNSLNADQKAQLKTRGYGDIEAMWNDVTGYDPTQKQGISGNMAYANPCGARYLTRENPKLDEKTAYNVSPFVVYSGLLPTDFYNSVSQLSFNSSKTVSHNNPPSGPDVFSVLEGFPHNKVHNHIGGVGPVDPGPYGNMTNFLSPVDPIFFLHHANMDRLWDVWTRKQQHLDLPYLPKEPDLSTLSKEPFLFYVNGKGEYVGASKAGDYLSTDRFEYDYEPGFGENVVGPPRSQLMTTNTMAPVRGVVKGNAATASVPADAIRNHLAAPLGASLFAEVTMTRPSSMSSAREFDVLIGAPADVTTVDASSPYYAGTISFFGPPMKHMGASMTMDATFAVPLPHQQQAFRGLMAAAPAAAVSPVSIRVVPAHGHGDAAPAIKSVSVKAR
jgi:tyrosinase